MDNRSSVPVKRSVIFRSLKYILIALLVLLLVLMLIGIIAFIVSKANKNEGLEKYDIAYLIITSAINFATAIVGLIAAIREKYVQTLVCGVIFILLAIANFVLGVHWLGCSVFMIVGIIAVCFAVMIKKGDATGN